MPQREEDRHLKQMRRMVFKRQQLERAAEDRQFQRVAPQQQDAEAAGYWGIAYHNAVGEAPPQVLMEERPGILPPRASWSL